MARFSAEPVAGDLGVFGTLDEAVTAANTAYRQLNLLPLDIRQKMVSHMRQAGRENATVLAEMAHSETGMGRVADKVLKNLLNADKAPGTEALDTGAWSGDGGLTIVEYAPYGVIGALTPSTNPTSTVLCNAISMVAAGNAVVFNAHPGSKGATNYTVQVLNQAIQKAGGPANLLTCVAQPTIESATALMGHKGIRLLVVTGGAAVVRAAMRSGKRAVCAGPGNPPVVVDESADIEQAGTRHSHRWLVRQQHRLHHRKRNICRRCYLRRCDRGDDPPRRSQAQQLAIQPVVESGHGQRSRSGHVRRHEQSVYRQERSGVAGRNWM